MAKFFRLETEMKHYLLNKNMSTQMIDKIIFILNKFKISNTICEKKSGLPTASTNPLSYQSTDRIKDGIWNINIHCIFFVTIMPMGYFVGFIVHKTLFSHLRQRYTKTMIWRIYDKNLMRQEYLATLPVNGSHTGVNRKTKNA